MSQDGCAGPGRKKLGFPPEDDTSSCEKNICDRAADAYPSLARRTNTHDRACVDERKPVFGLPLCTMNNGMKIVKLMRRCRLFMYTFLCLFFRNLFCYVCVLVCVCALVAETSWRATAVFVDCFIFFRPWSDGWN